VEIRRALGIKEGDKVELSLGNAGQALVILRLVRSIAEATFGAVTPRKQPEDFQELRREFEDGV
jgi:bifunctional DNA-binding transcriptional regulator/antitoxin component of YhaV-PrlF toxin-antitoxin module